MVGLNARIDDERVVALGAHAIVVPAVFSEIAGQVVIVCAEVYGPADTVSIENKSPEIEVVVVGLVVAGLEADKERT